MATCDTFSFRFDAMESDSETPPVFSGRGRLTICVGNEVAWGEGIGGQVEGEGFEEYWDGLLLHLAKIRSYLLADQAYPQGYFPKSPALFLDEALSELRWAELPSECVADDEREIFAFARRHNLAESMPGANLPDLFLIREGCDMRLVSETADVRIPVQKAMATLDQLGNSIAKVVSAASPRGKPILMAWKQCQESLPSPEEILVMNTGLPLDRLRRLAANDDLIGYFGKPSLEEPSPMQMAARMTRFNLLEQDQKAVLHRVATMRLIVLDPSFIKLRGQAELFLSACRDYEAYDQGYRLARWLRSELRMADAAPVDPAGLLAQWNVLVTKTQISDVVDAIARWEQDRAGILLNGVGLRSQKSWGEKATLAHEIAHLLVDTQHALPAIEILNSLAHALWEKRANAFAAEFLLPASQVATFLPDTVSPESLDGIIETLSERFGVGHTIAARQIQNQLARENRLDTPTRLFLDRVDRYNGAQANNWMKA